MEVRADGVRLNTRSAGFLVMANRGATMQMRAARMYGYDEPLRLEEIPVPDITSEEVLLKVAAAGMCRSDFQLMNGYFREGIPMPFPITPGHEVRRSRRGR